LDVTVNRTGSPTANTQGLVAVVEFEPD